jgi:cell division protein FtsI/penicillin-binding protein 2
MVAAVANGGKLMKPYVVKKIVGPKGAVEIEPREARQVLKPSTAATMRELLLTATEGDGKRKIPYGYRVAGKTGTAQVAVGGRYSGKPVASLIGFGPVEDPRFAAIVVLFQPSTPFWAILNAEPLFFEMVKELYPYWGIPVHK